MNKPKSTGEKVRVRFTDSMSQRQRHQTLTVYETEDGTRCVKKMGRGCWVWYKIDESGDVVTIVKEPSGMRRRVLLVRRQGK